MKSFDWKARRTGAIALLAAVAAAAAPAHADDSAPGSAAANIAEPISIVKNQDLDFGQIIVNGTGIARVVINARTGARTANVNATLLSSAPFGRALFTVTGQPATNVDVTLGSATIVLTGPGAPITVDNLRLSRNNGGQVIAPAVFLLPASGTMSVGFGGRLNAATNQAPGTYSGTFAVTATYQ